MELHGKAVIFGFGGVGLVALLTGVILEWYGNSKIVLAFVSMELPLRNGTASMRRWQKTPQAMLFQVYILNVTNPDEVDSGADPRFNELGPYVYDQWKEKVDVAESDNDTLSYRLKTTFLFNPKLSRCYKESDLVTIINLPLVATIQTVQAIAPDALGLLEDAWTQLFPGLHDAFLTGTVKDILFDGITIDCTSKDFLVTMVCNNMEGKVPDTIRKEGKSYKFSFFHHKNTTSKEVFKVYRGIQDVRKVGQTYGKDNSTSFGIWDNDYCNMMNGSDGTQFQAALEKKEKIYMFQNDVCRSLYARFEKDVYRNGHKLYRYTNTPDLFATKEENPENACYCSRPPRLEDLEDGEKDCPKRGAMLLTPCVRAPVVATFPHFYMGDESFVNYTGLKPEKTLHETFVDIEPLTGTPVQGFRRIQFNIEIKPIPEMFAMTNLSSGLFPVLWVEEGSVLTEENFRLLTSSLSNVSILYTATYVMIGVGVGFLIIAYLLYAKKNQMCCWESSISETRLNSHQIGYDNHAFGAEGLYTDKVNTVQLFATGNGKQFNGYVSGDRGNFSHPRSRRSTQFRRQSNVVSYIENFM